METVSHTLGELLRELERLPHDLVVRSIDLKMRTTSGNVVDYRYPTKTLRQHDQGAQV